MSGTIGNLPGSYLPGLFTWGTASVPTSSLLNTVYGLSTQAANLSGQTPVGALNSAERNETREITATAARPEVKRDVATFRTAVVNAKSVSDVLSNPAVMRVLLTANGLADQIPYTALARRALMSDTTDPKSLSNTLTDTRWKSTAQTYDFAHKGLSVIQDPKVLDAIANGYAEVTWRQSLDATTPGLSDALTFRTMASGVTSVDQILGNPVLRRVVTTALGLPVQIAFQTLQAQERAITSRLDITKFKKPSFVESFAQRYLIAASAGSGASSTSSPSITSLAIAARGLIV